LFAPIGTNVNAAARGGHLLQVGVLKLARVLLLPSLVLRS